MNPVRDGRPVEHPLHGELGFAVAVGRVRRVSFQNGNALRLAVGRRRGRKDDVLHAVLDHALQHRPRTAEVVVIVLQRVHHALADLGVRGKVDDRVNFLRREHVIAELFIADVALIEPRLRMDGLAEACLQIVCDHDIVAIIDQLIYRVAADIACAA